MSEAYNVLYNYLLELSEYEAYTLSFGIWKFKRTYDVVDKSIRNRASSFLISFHKMFLDMDCTDISSKEKRQIEYTLKVLDDISNARVYTYNISIFDFELYCDYDETVGKAKQALKHLNKMR